MHTDVKIFNCIGLTNSIKRMAYECAPLSEYIPLIQVLLLRKVASLFGIRIEYLFRNQLLFSIITQPTPVFNLFPLRSHRQFFLVK